MNRAKISYLRPAHIHFTITDAGQLRGGIGSNRESWGSVAKGLVDLYERVIAEYLSSTVISLPNSLRLATKESRHTRRYTDKTFFAFILAVLGSLAIGQDASKAQGFTITITGGTIGRIAIDRFKLWNGGSCFTGRTRSRIAPNERANTPANERILTYQANGYFARS
jgi:hypothetical protein